MQKHTSYGLSRSTSNNLSNKDLSSKAASVVRRSQVFSTIQHQHQKNNVEISHKVGNPFGALHDRDMNQSNERSTTSIKIDNKSAKKVMKNGVSSIPNQKVQNGQHQRQRSSKHSKSPSMGGAGAQNRVSNVMSPSTNSQMSTGKKMPCISALMQHQSVRSSQNTAIVKAPSVERSAQKSAQKSSTRYEIIDEQENDGSSFLMHEREANQEIVIEEVTDDSRSQLSQNLIGAHLIKNKEAYQHYPFGSGSVFQTPKPDRDDYNTGQKSNQSPMTSYRNQMSSNIQQKRQDQLQMSQKTNVTNKIVKNKGNVDYEAYGSQRQSRQQLSPMAKENKNAITESEYAEVQTNPDSRAYYVSTSNNKELQQLASFQQNRQSSLLQQSSSKKRNTRYDNHSSAVELSGLALNVRKQTSPEQLYNEGSRSPQQQSEQILSPEPAGVVYNGAGAFVVTVQPITNDYNNENSYDHDNGTRLMSDTSPLSPESNNRGLNPYQSSIDRSSKRFSSMNNKGCSPAQIRLEPVQMSRTTAFDEQKIEEADENSETKTEQEITISPVMQRKSQRQSRSPAKYSRSPVKKASPVKYSVGTAAGHKQQKSSPIKKTGVKQQNNMQIEILSQESPDAGNPILAQMIAENLKRIDEDIAVNERAKQDPSIIVTESNFSQSMVTLDSKKQQIQRPKSSASTNNGQTRRKRDQRVTPSGRQSAKDTFLQNASVQKQREDELRKMKRMKYNGGAVAAKREKLNTSNSPLEQPIVSTVADKRQSSTSATRNSALGLKRANSSNQLSGPMSMAEQIRLANREKARQYGNRASQLNKSGIERQSSPSKETQDPNANSPDKTYSPIQPEIMNVCDSSVDTHLSAVRGQRRSASRNNKSALQQSNTSISRSNQRDTKLIKPSQKSKLEFLTKKICAKKIQKHFRGYLLQQEQRQREQELQQEIERQEQEAHMVYINGAATKIQRAFTVFMHRIRFQQAVLKRHRLKMIVTDLVMAWKTRRSLNCLGIEVQEFVNCENEKQRRELRSQFHSLFVKVMKNKLYLEDNFDNLQKLRTQIALKTQQALAKNKKNQPSHCERRAKDKILKQQFLNNSGSPFKQSPFKKQPSPAKIASPAKQASPMRKQAVYNSNGSNNIVLQNLNESGFQNSQSGAQLTSKSSKQTQFHQFNQTQDSKSRSRENNQRMTLQRNGSSQRQIGKLAAGGNHRNSMNSINSGRQDETFNQVRESIDIHGMNELKNFIQNSGRQEESFCSIQVTGCLKPNNERNKSIKNICPNESSATNGQNQVNQSSQVVIQVHNGRNQDMISPTQKSTDAAPVNIMLGSCTRFSKEMTSNRGLATAEKNVIYPLDKFVVQRKVSQEGGTEYRQNLKKVRPRVDCWNRSGTREQVTPNNRKNTMTVDQVSANGKTMNESYRNKSDSGIKTPVHGATKANLRQPLSSFSNCAARPATAASNKTPQSIMQQHRQSQEKVSRADKVQSQIKTGYQEYIGRSRTPNQVSSNNSANIRQHGSMLREPTKFNNTSGTSGGNQHKDIQVRRMQDYSSHAVNNPQPRPVTPIAAVSNRLEQLAKPKSLIQQSQAPRERESITQKSVNLNNSLSQALAQQSANPLTTNLRQFINANGKEQQINNPQRRSTNLSVQHLNQHKPQKNLQNQIAEMREQLSSLSQVMETIAADADQNQKSNQRDTSGFGLNSQNRAAQKSLANHEKTFQQLMSNLQAQFVSLKDMATPGGVGQ